MKTQLSKKIFLMKPRQKVLKKVTMKSKKAFMQMVIRSDKNRFNKNPKQLYRK